MSYSILYIILEFYFFPANITTIILNSIISISILDFVVIVTNYCGETKVSLHLRCSVIIIIIVVVIINAGW